MTELRFIKMHGGGNDFVLLDGMLQNIPADLPAAQIANRRLGIGCDQILILEPPHESAGDIDSAAADFSYRIINADGGEVGQCGNGARCAHAYLRRRGETKKQLRLQTKTASILTEDAGDNQVRAYLATPQFAPAEIPLNRKTESPHYRAAESEGGTMLPGDFIALSLGNPHAVFMFATMPTAAALSAAGKTLNGLPLSAEEKSSAAKESAEERQLFPQGVNVSFCVCRGDEIQMRVFERGAGETPSCGSAAVAAAVAAIRGGGQSPQRAMLPGGALLCGWEGGDNPAWLQGEINFVYEGVLRLPFPPVR